MATSFDIAAAVHQVESQISTLRDLLNEADAKLGDGDTGMTITRIVESWKRISGNVPEDAGDALAMYGRECARVSGSSLGAVFSIGLAAAARSVRGQSALGRDEITRALSAASDAINQRSGASLGDKTILDSLVAIRSAIEAAEGDANLFQVALEASGKALDEFRSRESKLGRARIYGSKSSGLDDPGMLAVQLMLRAIQNPQ